MGIYDREYYRDETRGSGWFSSLPSACRYLLIAHVGVFAAQVVLGPASPMTSALDARVGAIFDQFQVWRLVTSIFLHPTQDLLGLFFQMLILWMFGREIEAIYGPRDFLGLYLGAGAIGTLCWATVARFGAGAGAAETFGAAGPILAVFVVYALYYPHRELLLFFILPVQIWILLTIYILVDVIRMVQGEFGKAEAAGHLGAALFGYLFKVGDLRVSRLNLNFGLGQARRPKLRIVRPEARETAASRAPGTGPSWSPEPAGTARPASAAVVPEEQLDARLDEVLAKIAREGRGSLDDDENRILLEASRRARNRRSDRP